jgi:hypothetical protein
VLFAVVMVYPRPQLLAHQPEEMGSGSPECRGSAPGLDAEVVQLWTGPCRPSTTRTCSSMRPTAKPGSTTDRVLRRSSSLSGYADGRAGEALGFDVGDNRERRKPWTFSALAESAWPGRGSYRRPDAHSGLKRAIGTVFQVPPGRDAGSISCAPFSIVPKGSQDMVAP